ncbi:LamG-like jellyroll fold domain-containing protein [Haliangium sp.]|uniref:LamG-like jellyroll fold domain-containing protein n=1 Tax=Haliangium sp. TaxID=2663208 RepID=UPI003D14F20F
MFRPPRLSTVARAGARLDLAAIAVAVAFAPGCVISQDEAPPPPAQQSSALEAVPDQYGVYTVIVHGTRPDSGNPHDWWNDTGIDVAAGGVVGASCTGGLIRPWSGHNGFDCYGEPETEWGMAPECGFGSLIGKIGASGTPFCLGAPDGAIEGHHAASGGRLYLAFNDDVNFADNLGQWIARVFVHEPDPEPELHLSFDDCAGATATDDSGNQHHGTASGTACTSGAVGNARAFDGASALVEIPDHPRLGARQALTVSAWVNPARVTGPQTVANQWYAMDAWNLSVVDGEYVFMVSFADGGWGRMADVRAPAVANQWTHVTGVYDGATLSLYLNGALASQVVATGQLQASERPIVIGNHPSWVAFLGSIDEVRVYLRALSPDQVAAVAADLDNDRDGDGVYDEADLCPDLSDDQSDQDGDGLGDACDPCDLDPENGRYGACAADACAASCQRFITCVVEGGAPEACNAGNLCEAGGTACETQAMRTSRHAGVSQTRGANPIIVHRGSWSVAHENTLEAYRATFYLGGQGNEIDVRRTADGVLVMLHDDFLDQTLAAFGDVSDYTWEELRHVPFRRPGRFGAYARVPTLVESLDLHRRYGGLIHLDLKDLDAAPEVAALLTAMDMWDHVMSVTQTSATVIRSDPRFTELAYRCPALAHLRGDVDPARIAADISPAPAAFYVDEPRALALALGRSVQAPPREPVRWQARLHDHRALPAEAALVAVLEDDAGWDEIAAEGSPRAGELAARIWMRAMAADRLGLFPTLQNDTIAALTDRLSERSLHRDWRYHGLDAQVALEVLLRLGGPDAVDLAREAVWRDDPALDPIAAGAFPRAWVDWRIKVTAWLALAQNPDAVAAAALVSDYVALPAAVDGNACDDVSPAPAAAEQIGPLRFEEAAQAYVDLLANSGALSDSDRTARAVALLQHSDSRVSGRALLALLGYGAEPWVQDALSQAASFALPWIVMP